LQDFERSIDKHGDTIVVESPSPTGLTDLTDGLLTPESTPDPEISSTAQSEPQSILTDAQSILTDVADENSTPQSILTDVTDENSTDSDPSKSKSRSSAAPMGEVSKGVLKGLDSANIQSGKRERKRVAAYALNQEQLNL